MFVAKISEMGKNWMEKGNLQRGHSWEASGVGSSAQARSLQAGVGFLVPSHLLWPEDSQTHRGAGPCLADSGFSLPQVFGVLEKAKRSAGG